MPTSKAKLKASAARKRQKIKGDLPRYLKQALRFKRHNAKKSGIEFDLDEEWLQKQPLMCAVTGKQFVIPESGLGPLTPSFDRRDASKGYTKENTQLICFWLNAAKGQWPEATIRDLILEAAEVLHGNPPSRPNVRPRR